MHAFTNASSSEARMLIMLMPGSGTDKMFADLDTACRNCPDQNQRLAEVGRICGSCGVQFA